MLFKSPPSDSLPYYEDTFFQPIQTQTSTSLLTKLLSALRGLCQAVGLLFILHLLLFPRETISLSAASSLSSFLPLGASQSWHPILFHALRPPAPSKLDQWIEQQDIRSLEGVLANIGSTGQHAQGAKPGIVVASPSDRSPNYVYSWTRDAALVTKSLLERAVGKGDDSLLKVLEQYTTAQGFLQHVENPSGTLENGGLGEPKFNVDETAFTENWGRPQNDGPALRATTLMSFASHLLENDGQSPYVYETLVPIIKADLDFVVQYWNETGFDLWEEVRGSSFFTTAVQHRALVEGSTFFDALGSSNNVYSATAENVLCFLQSYWSPRGYIVSNINHNSGRGGLDGNSILASIHTFDSDATTCDRLTFQPCSDRALANHKRVVDSFRPLYYLNRDIPEGVAVAVGRYPEDEYYGGNGWYLITLAAAEQLYDSLYTWNLAGELNITSTSLPFFRDIYPAATVGNHPSATPAYQDIVDATRRYADGFFEVVQTYTPKDGSLAEQFDRDSGVPLSAMDLTWSYASFITATAARDGRVPVAWGSTGIRSSCSPAPTGPVVVVVFDEKVITAFGESVFAVGSIPALGLWNPAAALPLSAEHYKPDAPIWTGSAYLPSSTLVEFKFIRKLADGSIIWESGPNRSITTVERGSQSVDSSWQ